MGRAPCCAKVGLHRGPWTPREDALLTKYIQAHGEGQWRSLPKRAGLLRCGKSCRLRWMNYLRPDIKRGNITPEEDDLIIRMHSLLGNRWSLIAGRLPGRTDNEIKNYWNTHLIKKLRNQGTDPNTHKKLLSIKHPVHEAANKKKSTSRRKKKQEKSDVNDKDHTNTDTNTEIEKKKTVVYLPKPIRVSSSLCIPRTVSTTFTLESNNSGSASSIRSHEKLDRSQQEEEEEEEEEAKETNNVVWWELGNEGENDGFNNLFGGDGEDHHNLVNGSDDIEYQSYCSDIIPTDHGTLEKLYEEYFQLLNMDVQVEEENQHEMDSFAESLLV